MGEVVSFKAERVIRADLRQLGTNVG
jgi:hypothetical protein